MKNRKLLLLGLLLPFTMSNAPAPMPKMDEYKDIDVSYELIEESDLYRYKITLKNNGDKYASLRDMTTDISNNQLYSYEGLFRNEYVAPNKEREFVGSFFNKLSDEKEKMVTTCLTENDPNVIIENPSITKSDNPNENSYYFNADVSNLGDYNYWLMIDAIYKEEELSFVVGLMGSTKHFLFYANKQLDLKDLSIQKTTVFRGVKYKYFSCSGF